MYKKLALLALLLLCCIPFVDAVTPNAQFTPENYQGFLYRNQTITFPTGQSIVDAWDPGLTAYNTNGSVNGVVGFGRAQLISSPQETWTGIFWSAGTRPFTPPSGTSYYGSNTGTTTTISNADIATYDGYWVGEAAYVLSTNDYYTGRWWIIKDDDYIAPVNVTFYVAESGNFTHKLDGVTITSSSGVAGTTDVNGSVTLTISPPASTYTYTAVKTGYVDATGDISVTGTYGGTIYFQMVPGAGSTTARTYLHAIDSLTGAHIGGSTISAKCNTNGTWQNSTTSTGQWLIDCAGTDTFNIYGSALGYTDASDTNIAAGGSYYLSLLPSGAAAPIGYTNVYVSVIDGYSSTPLTYATVTAALSSGSTTGDNTGSSGTVKFVLANNSVVIITASKSGYTSLSKSLSTGTGADIHTLITLSKTMVPSGTVTPVVTDPATGEVITPQPTYLPDCNPNDPYYSIEKCSKSQDSSFMAKIREWAPTILDLAIAAILFGLLAAIFGAMQKMTKW